MLKPKIGTNKLSKLRLVTLVSIGVLIAMLIPTQTTFAEGSANLTDSGGYRPWLLWSTTTATGGIDHTPIFKVYAEVGEIINLGSSAHGIGVGLVEYRDPTTVVWTTCSTAGDIGRIETNLEEINGIGVGGYNPCTVTVAAGQTGVWEVRFVSPNPAAGYNNNPPTTALPDTWDVGAGGQPNGRYIRAWDITVTSGVGTPILGRVYADYLPFTVGGNIGNADVLTPEVYIFTEDGYGYVVDMNGIDPFVFVFLSNNKGLRGNSGDPIFRSLQFVSTDDTSESTADRTQQIPAGYSIHLPNLADNAATNDYTHKIFFNTPDFATLNLLPGDTAPSPSGNIVFQIPPIDPPTASALAFTGIEGTPGNAGTDPLGGNFTFNATKAGSFTITLDTNRSNTYGDGTDRIITGFAQAGGNTVFWDGLDQAGNPVTAGNVAFGAQIVLYGGEVHFPFFDPENNRNGLIIQRVLDPGTTLPLPDAFTIKYDDRYNYNDPLETYDYSLCALADNAFPPPPFAVSGVGQPYCEGVPPAPREAVLGVSAPAGGHLWSGRFGNHRGMDTWANYPNEPFEADDIITLRQADLIMDKVHTTNPVVPGGAIEYVLTVSNPNTDDGGASPSPSDAPGSTVSDNFPPTITVLNWTCVGSGGATCNNAAGVGNITNEIVNLPNGSFVTFTINAQVSAAVLPGDTITNTATVLRPNDVTDPTDPNRLGLGNNTDDDSVVITAPTSTPTPTPSNTSTPTNTPSVTNTPTNTDTPSVTPSGTPPATNTPTDTPSVTATPTITDTPSPGPSPTPSDTPTITDTPSPGPSPTPSDTPSPGPSPTPSDTPSPGPSPTPSDTPSPGPSPTPSDTPSPGPSPTPSDTPGGPSATPSPTNVGNATPTPTLLLVDPFISKSASPPFALPGEIVTWTIMVTNPNTIPITHVTVTDDMPAEVEIISVSATSGNAAFSGQIVTWTIGSLPPQTTVTITVVTRVRLTVKPPYILNNIAAMTADGINTKTASAAISSAAKLPATGESPFELWLPVLAIVLAAGVLNLAWRQTRRRIS